MGTQVPTGLLVAFKLLRNVSYCIGAVSHVMLETRVCVPHDHGLNLAIGKDLDKGHGWVG
jgi:hypothetical protein